MVSSVLVALLLPGLAACASAQQAAPAAPQKPRSLLVVTFDTTRRDCMGFLGKSPSVTPNLDRLAARSCVFTDAYTVAPITLPAHCSLMTGLYPISHGVHENTSFKLPQTAVTLAEILKQHGYATAATVGAIVLDPMFGLDQGFDHYDSPNRRDAHVGINVAERHADEQADLALKEIAALAPRAPFFYWVHFFDPHFPYEAPEHFAVTPGVAALPDEMARHAYLEELWYADKHLGRLLDQLESSGLAKELVVVFAADHGESLGDTPEPAHGYFLFDPTVRIPLLIRDPAQAPRRVETQASLVDVVPTVLDLLGVPADPELRFDGADLAPIVRGTSGEGPERALLLETRMTALNFGWAPFDGCVLERMKYVHSARDELFDRKADPDEKKSLFDPEESRSKAFVHRLQALLSSSVVKLARDALKLGEDDRRQMLKIGYAVADPSAGDSDVPWDRSKLPDSYAKAALFKLMDDELGAESVGDFTRATELMRELSKAEPGSARFHEQLGTLLHDNGPVHLDEAEQHLQAAVKIDPRRGHVYYLLALCMEERWSKTAAELAEARRTLAPGDDAASARVKELVQKERSQADHAVLLFHTSLELEPNALDCLRDCSDFLFKQAARHERGKRAAKARDEYREVVTHLDRLLTLLPPDEKTRPQMEAWRAQAQANVERLEKSAEPDGEK